MANNDNLHKANVAKKDEFYTQLQDIENELHHYTEFFKGKTVLCNCDDPYESYFFYYFASRFNDLGLKKLICTCYDGSPIAHTQISFLGTNNVVPLNDRHAYKIVITEVKDQNEDGVVDITDVEYLIKNEKNVLTLIEGNGDFRSAECIGLLTEADVVVTNPPFSLFREYVSQLIEYDKKFIIIGNQNAITYKEIFPLIMNNKMWLGYGFKGNVGFFINAHYEDYAKSSQHKDGMIRVSGVMWYTNIDTTKRHERLIPYKTYAPDEYSNYDNYNAINVDKTAEIPCDYDGIMGVPITFMNKYNPEQFDILGMCENLDLYGLKTKVYSTQECKQRYWEIFGKKGTYDLNASGVVKGTKVYQRILIRRKLP